jgi:3-hydroxyisobutyrate dehydrogenase-like beta-hydroxyacid dehydrogenase
MNTINESRSKERTIGFIGLGNMGFPIARNLLTSGYPVRVFNRTKEKALPLAELGATVVDNQNDVIDNGGIVFSILADDEAVRAVTVRNPEFLKRLGPGGIHVSMSTISPETARDLAEEHSKQGVSYLGSPVSGRPERAAARKLFILLAGSQPAKERVLPLLESISEKVFDFGEDPWKGNVAKLVLNFNIMASVETMAESFVFAEKNGISRERMAELLSETLFGGIVYKSYGQDLAHHKYEPAGFRLRLGWKDIRLLLETARENAIPMPVGSVLRDRMLSAIAKGRGDLDWSAIALAASEDAGLR